MKSDAYSEKEYMTPAVITIEITNEGLLCSSIDKDNEMLEETDGEW